MSLRLRTAVTDGLRLTFSRNGAVFIGLNGGTQLLSLLLVAVAATQKLPVSTGIGVDPVAEIPISQSLPTAATVLSVGLTTVFSAIVTTPIAIIAIRTFVDGAVERIPEAHFFGDIGQATVRGLTASLLFGIVITVGFLLSFLVPAALGLGIMFAVEEIAFLPGWIGIIGFVIVPVVSFAAMLGTTLVVYIHLMFVLHEISVRNRSVIESLRGSWEIVRGHRLKLGVLSVGLMLIQGTINSISTPSQFANPTVAETLTTSPSQLLLLPVGVVVISFMTTLSAAIIARAYAELTGVKAVGGKRSDIDDGDDPTDTEAGSDADESSESEFEPAV